MRYRYLFLTVFFFLSGCAYVPAQGPSGAKETIEDTHALAQALVTRIIEKYRGFTRDSFEDEVAANFVPARAEFIDLTGRNALDGTVLSFDYFIEKALRNRHTLSVEIKWEKKIQAYGAASPQLTRGIATLVFKMQDDRWRLYQITGDNPF